MPTSEKTAKKSGNGSRLRLTGAQLEKKRKFDRESQRLNRLKTKNRISYLENLVKALQEGGGQSARIKQLVEQVRTSHEEIARLQEILRGVYRLVEAHKDPSTFSKVDLGDQVSTGKTENPSQQPSLTPASTDGEEGAEPQDRESGDSDLDNATSSGTKTTVETSYPDQEESGNTEIVSVPNCKHKRDELHKTPDNHSPSPASSDGQALSWPDYNKPTEVHLTFVSNEPESPCASLTRFQNQDSESVAIQINNVAKQIYFDHTLDGRLWYLVGTLLKLVLSMPRNLFTPQAYEEDITIRAVLHGWANAAAHYQLDPGWLWLRHVDETLYPNAGFPERMAVIRIMRLQFRSQVQPSESVHLSLPKYMRARPAQQILDHDPLVEYWAWPGFREHILFSPRKYATNLFMESFRRCIRFAWPYSSDDTYHTNITTGMYEFSSAFIEKQLDVSAWRMKSDFFGIFPELQPDIASYDPSPWNQQILTSYSHRSAFDDQSWRSQIQSEPENGEKGSLLARPARLGAPFMDMFDWPSTV